MAEKFVSDYSSGKHRENILQDPTGVMSSEGGFARKNKPIVTANSYWTTQVTYPQIAYLSLGKKD